MRLLALVLSLATTALVAGNPDDLDALRTAQRDLQAEISAGRGAYKDMPPERRDALLKDQARLLAMIEGRASLRELDPAERSAVQTLVAQVEAAQRQAEDDRIVCRRERRTGTNVASNVCRSVGERRSDREAARTFIQGSAAQCTDPVLCPGG